MKKAAFSGSFDPPTFGHLNIIERSASIFDELVIVVAENRQKKYLFSAKERIGMLEELVKPWKNVSVMLCESLIVDFIKKNDITLIVRGVRGMGDFSYEFEVSMMNKAQDINVETIFLATDPEYFVVRSSSIKEIASFGGDVSAMVPPLVNEALKKKFD
jgi:pantetheine-phosphate adenylyltransferase